MEIKFNVTGTARKALVTAVSEVVGMAPVYKGAPTFAYAVNNFIIDKNGTITGEITRELLDALTERGFYATETPTSNEEADAPYPLVIEIPKDGFTDESIANLEKLVESKAALIKKAIGTDSLQIEQTDATIRCIWLRSDTPPEMIKSCTRLITALCTMAKEQKRITAREKEVANEKYAFRCFLLRLGFIGDEFKADRKILLANLSGNSAFKNGEQKKNDVETESPNYNDTAEMLADAELIHAVNASFEEGSNE